MNLERDVILDLLPLYAAGELTPASRKLVEEALAADPGLRKLAAALSASAAPATLTQLDSQLDALLGSALPPAAAKPTAEEEKRSFSRARRLMGLRSILIGAAIFTTLAIFTFWVDQDGVTMLLQMFPALVRNLVLVAVLLWVLAFFAEFLWDTLDGMFKKK